MMKRLSWVLSGALALGAVAPAMVSVPAEAQRWHDGYRGTHPYDDRYDRRYYDRRDRGGIGPGKGALIGAGGGALLGALLGGGAKGALIGGAAGAGVGALAGKAAADNRHRRDWRDGYRY
jgi:hypothetical protein